MSFIDSQNVELFHHNIAEDSFAMKVLDDLFRRNILNATQKSRFLQAFESYKKAKIQHFHRIVTNENYKIEEYKQLRCMDYGSHMDFVILEAFYELNINEMLYKSKLFQSILDDVCYHGVLVNDILSLPKEVENSEFRNWIIIEFVEKGIQHYRTFGSS